MARRAKESPAKPASRRRRSLWALARESVVELVSHDPLRMAAALSYYTLLSLAPLILVVVSIAGLAFGRDAVAGRIVGEIEGLVGHAGAEIVQTVLENAHQPERGTLSLVLGVVLLVVGASSVFVELQSALNTLWRVEASVAKARRRNRLVAFVRDRLLSLAMVFVVGFLLLVSLVVSAGLGAASAWLGARTAVPEAVWNGADALVSFGVVTLLFASIFRFLPDAKIRWRDVRIGALVTAGLFTLGKQVIGLYVGRASIGSAYGAAGSLVVLMVWVDYAALIFFLGAQITQVISRGDAEPVEYADRAHGDGSH